MRIDAPSAPMAAASVGDAIPAKIEPNTATTRIKGRIKAEKRQAEASQPV